MPDAVAAPEAQPLSEVARVVDTFVAPTKTFTDIRRNASWWLPFLLTVIVSIFFTAAVGKQVGWETIAHQNVEKNHFAADRINSLPKDQQAIAYQNAAKQTKIFSYGFSILGLGFAALFALLWWASAQLWPRRQGKVLSDSRRGVLRRSAQTLALSSSRPCFSLLASASTTSISRTPSARTSVTTCPPPLPHFAPQAASSISSGSGPLLLPSWALPSSVKRSHPRPPSSSLAGGYLGLILVTGVAALTA